MRPQDLIEKKRDRGELSKDEIAFLIRGYTSNEIPDYQMSAFLMAAFLNGMSDNETTSLLNEMLHSGEVLQHNEISLPKVDKHSTGGVGDKTSLVIAPVAAACGVCVPMISGRALAHTGGTLDKLESIPGFRTDLSLDEFRATLKNCGLSLIGQTKEIAPADKKIYALRDLTATVPFRPFIVASILSKKLAAGIDGLVLDVKFGNGAFMREFEDAKKLAEMLVNASRAMGKKTVALLTNMNQPLGRWVGNAVETMEAIEVLRGKITGDFAALSIELSAHMLVVGGVTNDLDIARRKALSAIDNGSALEKFRQCIEAQSGDPRVVDDFSLLPKGKYESIIIAQSTGYISKITTDEIGRIVMDWGGGRKKLEDKIDYGVGLYIHAKLGDRINIGDPLITAYFNDENKLPEMRERILKAYEISDNPPQLEPLIKEIIVA
jgi:pyrimidine-nucleoside phosphorylase